MKTLALAVALITGSAFGFTPTVKERAMNFDEAKVKPYVLEDPLVFADGRKVSAADWPARRQEMLGILAKEMFGAEPPKPETIVLEGSTNELVLAGFAVRRRYRMWFKADRSGPCIDWAVWIPNRPIGRTDLRGQDYMNPLKDTPVVVLLNYEGNYIYADDPFMPLPGGAGLRHAADEGKRGYALRQDNRRHLPLQSILARGYSVMTARYEQIAPDDVERMYEGVLSMWPKDAPDAPRTIGAWAWALSRGLDLAERIPEIDARKSVVTGSSRLGKAALLAGARDERFAVVVPNQTGGGGVPLWKRDYGENVSMFFRRDSSSWFVPSFRQYADNEAALPFDMHFLVASVAPRHLLVEGWTEAHFDPRGEFLALKTASPVWELLFGSGLPKVDYPASYETSAIGTRLGYVHRGGDHGIAAIDWKWTLDFADRAFEAVHQAFTITVADKTKIIDDRYPEVKPTREELRSHQEHGYIVCIRGVKSREAAGYYRSLGVERFIDADPALWERPKNSIDKAIDEVRKLDLAAEDAWFALKDESAFEARRLKLRADMTAAIGGFPERTPLNPKTAGTFARKGCRIEKVMFESEPNHHVTAYLFLPDDAAKAPYPAVIVPLGHSNDGKRCKGYFKAGVVAAQAGIAALVYDPIDQGERPQIAGTRLNCVEGHIRTGLRASLVGWHGARFRIWDGIRALDYLESRPDIDSSKLAIMGQSGGGTLTSYIAALDTRVKASCPAGFVTTSRDLVEFWGPQDCEQNIPGAMKLGLNHLSLMMMASPRPVELILAEDDAFPPFGSFTTLAKMRKLYARLGIPERVDYNIAMGRMHGWYDCSREASVRWIRRWLTGVDVPAPKVADEDALPPAENEADAFVVPGGMVSSLPGERGTYDIIRTRADAVAAKRPPLTRELVAKISGIDVAHPCGERENVDCVRNGYWSFIKTPADELACIYDWLGTSIVRTRAERMIAEARAYAAAHGGAKIKLVAKGHEAIAAAHAHYLAPELFSGIEISDPPPSWRKAIDDPNLPLSPQDVVAGAFASYDWTDLLSDRKGE